MGADAGFGLEVAEAGDMGGDGGDGGGQDGVGEVGDVGFAVNAERVDGGGEGGPASDFCAEKVGDPKQEAEYSEPDSASAPFGGRAKDAHQTGSDSSGVW